VTQVTWVQSGGGPGPQLPFHQFDTILVTTNTQREARATHTVPGIDRVGSTMRAQAPVYPPIAISARIQGLVMIEANVEPSGHVRNAHVLRSIPLLDEAAKDAVMLRQFTPTLVNGKPVPVVVTTTLQFTLMF